MSNRRTIADFPRNEAGLVDEFIGTAYDVVKAVYDALPEINEFNETVADIPNLATDAVDAALAAAMPAVHADLDTYVQKSKDWAEGTVPPDPLNPQSKSSKQWSEVSRNFSVRFLTPTNVAPLVRDDGTPLQEGDFYHNTDVGLSYTFANSMWMPLNQSVQQLILDLANVTDPAKGGNMVWVKSPFAGAVARSIADTHGDSATLEDFGAIGDGQYHPLSVRFASLALAQEAYPDVPITSLTQSIDWAATWAAFNFAGPKVPIWVLGVYVLTDSVEMSFPPKLIGTAHDRDTNLSATVPTGYKLTNSAFVTYGDGVKKYTVMGVTSGSNNGGVWANPDQAFTLDSQYELADYYDDAGNPKLFSALFKFKFGTSSAHWTDIVIMKGFWVGNDSTGGYRGKLNGWGDKWDFGVYMDNARTNTFERVSILGYWDMNGLLIRSGALDTEPDYINSGVFSGAEENKFFDCAFQGWKAIGNRSIDMYKIINVQPTYIDIPYSATCPFWSYRRLRQGELGGLFYTLTGVERVGDVLRLYTQGNPVGFLTIGMEVGPSFHGNGVAGTVFRDCRTWALNHASNRRCSDSWHTEPRKPAACLEISGTRIRGLRWESSKCQTVDDIGIHAHQAIDLMLSTLRLEGNPDVNGIGGIRMLSSNTTYTHAIRTLFRTRELNMEQDGADFRPQVSRIPNKFPSTVQGMWLPVLYATDARHGICIGGMTDQYKLSKFSQGGFTIVMQTSDGDGSFSGVARHGLQQQVGNMLNLQFSYYSGTATYTTGNGQIQFNLPAAPNGFTGSVHLPIQVDGTAGGKVCSIELTAGNILAKLYYQPVGGTAVPLRLRDLVGTSGTVMRISGTLSYRVDVVNDPV